MASIHLQKQPIAAPDRVNYILKTAMGFGSFIMDDLDRAKAYRDKRNSEGGKLYLVKQTITEEMIDD